MSVSIPLMPGAFGPAERVVAQSGAFFVTAWRTGLGIEMLRIANGRGHVDVLPFMGQMVWDAVFDGVRLTMDSAFPEPRPATSIVETYGCLAYRSGLLRNGCPAPEDDHPLHGEMPCKRMDSARLEFDTEGDGAPVVRVAGHVDHVLGFGPNYRARPSVTVDAGTTIAMGMQVENRSALPMDLMYMAHVNFAFVADGVIHQAAPFSPMRTRVRSQVPAHVVPTDAYRAFLEELGERPEAGRVLDRPERWDPEQVIYVDAPGTDEDGLTHAMLKRPGGDGFVMRYAPSEFPRLGRWILHGADATVAAFALPATCEPEGYLAEKAKGNIAILAPGQARALLDAVMARHGVSTGLSGGASGAAALSDRLDALAPEGRHVVRASLTRARHVQPDFHGNRAPLADPDRRGMIVGLTLETGTDDLALDYLATVQALAYGTRAILDAMEVRGITVAEIVMSGGLAGNADYVMAHADATGCRVLLPEGEEPVLRGVAIAAAVAAGAFAELSEGTRAMAGPARTVSPDPALRAYHDRKYPVFKAMQAHFDDVRRLMAAEDEHTAAPDGRED